jgi:25S rRNA (uracil2843-N3)-methyltransferase
MAPRKKQKVVNKSHTGQNPPKQIISAQKVSETQAAPIELQQALLDVFCRAFNADYHHQQDVNAVIQEVKGHLFSRDFAQAFAKQEYLDAYALRWSASRALGYLDILLHGDLQPVWLGEISSRPGNNANDPPQTTSSSGACRFACIGGGGGAEVAACAAAALPSFSLSKAEIHAIDIADWSSCVEKLTTALTTPHQLSVYASESAKAANKPLIDPGCLHVRFSQHDVLNINEDSLRGLLGGVNLCTIMFALNELFTNSIARTTAFLLALTDTMALGSWLLVVDSPGSYSEVKLGDGETAKSKRYPMKWLLDHTLLEVAGGEKSKWSKHVSDDSRWFRLSPTLRYPIDLENMRYQIHLYQRIESDGS